MGMQTCAACGGACRRTVIAIVIGGEKPERARVCKQCERRGTFIVPLTRAIVNDTAKAEKKEQRDVLAPFITRCESIVKAKMIVCDDDLTSDYLEGQIAAFEAVVHMLKEGRA